VRPGLVARVGQACLRYRWLVLAAWVAIVASGFSLSGKVFDGLSQDSGMSLESVRAYEVLQAESQVGGSVIAEITGVDPAAAGVRNAVTASVASLATIPGVRHVATPFDGVSPGMVASDGSGLLVEVTMADFHDHAARSEAVDKVTTTLDRLPQTLRDNGSPQAAVLLGGGEIMGDQVGTQVEKDLGLAEKLSLPITLVVLIFVFGGVIAAGLPVLGAIASVFGAMAALYGFEQFTDLDQNATIVVTLLGLGLAIDYGLLLVARYREELRHGDGQQAALARTWSSAGRTIVFSALTVAGSLCGLLVFGMTSMTALGVAGVSIAVIAMSASLTLTAALLGFGRKRIRPSRRRNRSDDSGFFAGLARMVQRRPIVVAGVTAILLIGAGLPMLSTTPRVDSVASLPTSLSSVRVAHDLADKYGRSISPAVTVVARTDAATLDAWAQRWHADAAVTQVAPAQQVSPGLSMVDIYVPGDPEGAPARALVGRVRADRPAAQSWVGGDAALLDDMLGLIAKRLPWVIGITVLAMFVLLFLMTGSVLVPLKAVVMNALSLGATVGVMNLVFERGWGAGFLHTLTTHSLDPFVIVGVLAFAFGLSMDYEVFLLSRIKEHVDAGDPNDVAVRRGLQRSGRVITSAALCMVIVFGCFLVGRTGNTQQIGLGLAAAIALDATIVRCLLVPATMTLLGRWNWWAPKGLARWHSRRVAAHVAEERELVTVH
jgi:RND superfamily putative drug exporter